MLVANESSYYSEMKNRKREPFAPYKPLAVIKNKL
jgi:hypothetical protein